MDVGTEANAGRVSGHRAFFSDVEGGLVDHARHVFGLSLRGKDGATLRSHLEASAKRGSITSRKALVAPPLPAGYAYLLDWFFELHGRRGAGMQGPASLTWPDLDAWARRTGREPTPWEFRVLSALDEAFFAAVREMS